MENKFKFLVKMSFLRKIKNKSFIIGNIIVLIIIALLVNIDSVVSFFGGDFNDNYEIRVVDNANYYDDIKKDLSSINNSLDKPYIKISKEDFEDLFALKDFNYHHIYKHSLTTDEYDRYRQGMRKIYQEYLLDIKNNNLDSVIFKDFLSHQTSNYLEKTKDEQKVVDFIAGMTDYYFIKQIS